MGTTTFIGRVSGFAGSEMNRLEIQTGTPPEPGRYVVWMPCAALQVREWCEPSIASYHDGKWHTYDPVWAWIGPLPVVHGDDCLQKERTDFVVEPEYDL
jgi:hypothetical protein